MEDHNMSGMYSEAGVGVAKVTEARTVGNHLDMFHPTALEIGTMRKREYVFKTHGTLDNAGPYTFLIPGESNLYIATNSMRVHGKIKLTKLKTDKSGYTDLEPSDKGKVSLENLFGNTLFNSISVMMNGFTVSSVSSPHSHYKAYITTVCSYNDQAAKTSLRPLGFAVPETAEINSEVSKLFEDSKTVCFSANLHCDVLRLDRLLLDQMALQITLNRTPDQFMIKTLDGDTNKYRLEFIDLELRLDKFQMTPNLHDQTVRALESGRRANYPFVRSLVKTYNIGKGSYSMVWNNALLGKKPDQLVVGIVDQDAFQGLHTKSGFQFKPHNLTEISISLGGQEYPIGGYKIDDWSTSGTGQVYSKVLKELCSENNTTSLLTPDMFIDNSTLFAFDLTPDGCGGFHAHDLGTAAISVKASFKSGTTANLTCVLFASFSDQFYIDKDRQVFIEDQPAV